MTTAVNFKDWNHVSMKIPNKLQNAIIWGPMREILISNINKIGNMDYTNY